MSLQSGVTAAYRYGQEGEDQQGIDILAENASGNATYQCRRVKQFAASDLKKLVEETTKEAAEHVVFIACKASKALRDECAKHNNWRLLDLEDISLEVRKLPADQARNLVGAFFGPFWADAFLEGTTKKITLLPSIPSPNFTNRTAELEKTSEGLVSHRMIWLHGITGTGKSELALQVASANATSFDSIVWIDATTPESVDEAFGLLWRKLFKSKAVPLEHAVQETIDWLEQNGGRTLLIFDNYDPSGASTLSYPKHGESHVIVTSDVVPKHDANKFLTINTDAFDPSAACDYLRKLTNLSEPEAKAIYDLVGGIPIALEICANYIRATGVSVDQFLERARNAKWEDIEKISVEIYGNVGFGKVLGNTLDTLVKEDPAALDLLRACACLGEGPIPRYVIERFSAFREEGDNSVLDLSIARLAKYSLLKADPENVYVHKLVQRIVFEQTPEDDRWKIRMRLAQVLIWIIDPLIQSNQIFDCLNLISHVSVFIDKNAVDGQNSNKLVQLSKFIGIVLLDTGHPALAEEWFRQSIWRCEAQIESVKGGGMGFMAKAFEQVEPDGHSLLGASLLQQGKFDDAREELEQGLALQRKYGTDSADFARLLNYFADYERLTGQLDKAETSLREVLRIRKNVLGDQDILIGNTYHNLGVLLSDKGDVGGAMDALRNARRIKEKVYGVSHVSVASTMFIEAKLLLTLGKQDIACKLFDRAFEIYEKSFGMEHWLAPTLALWSAIAWAKQRNCDKAFAMLDKIEQVPVSEGFLRAFAEVANYIGTDPSPFQSCTEVFRHWLEEVGKQPTVAASAQFIDLRALLP
ncbi:MAG: tetratricopeptide repeat protein [Candidatus Melainabacteria bacterium]|nr:tetratricopeptide repeat protein [Candidatus Melainabacteria bacterium]